MENVFLFFLRMGGFGPNGMWLMPIICIGICVIMFMIFRRGRRGPFSHGPRGMDNTDNSNSSAIDILNSRYAKGEISKEEYDSMKEDIS